MYNISRKFIAVILVVALCFSINTVAFASTDDAFSTDYASVEQRIEEKLSNATFPSSNVVFDSYFIGDVFVCTSLTSDGVTEYAYNTGEYIYYKQYSDGAIQYQTRYINDAIRNKATTEQMVALDAIITDSDLTDERKSSVLEEIGYHKVYIDDDVWYYELISNTPARTPVYTGGMDELLAAYPMQNGAYSSTKSFYCSYLSSYKNIIVRDIRTNYVEEGNITKDLIAGAAIVVAAASVWAAPASLLAWLGLSASVVTLPFDARVSRATNARTYRYRYGETYDTTRVNAYVTCSSEWGYDYYTVTDQGSGYAWGLNAYPTPLAEIYPDSTIANNAAYSYNNALDIYGCWPW